MDVVDGVMSIDVNLDWPQNYLDKPSVDGRSHPVMAVTPEVRGIEPRIRPGRLLDGAAPISGTSIQRVLPFYAQVSTPSLRRLEELAHPQIADRPKESPRSGPLKPFTDSPNQVLVRQLFPQLHMPSQHLLQPDHDAEALARLCLYAFYSRRTAESITPSEQKKHVGRFFLTHRVTEADFWRMGAVVTRPDALNRDGQDWACFESWYESRRQPTPQWDIPEDIVELLKASEWPRGV